MHDTIFILSHPEWTFGIIALAIMLAFIALIPDT